MQDRWTDSKVKGKALAKGRCCRESEEKAGVHQEEEKYPWGSLAFWKNSMIYCCWDAGSMWTDGGKKACKENRSQVIQTLSYREERPTEELKQGNNKQASPLAQW